MTPTGPVGIPPGWYPDPSGEKAWRWWDGLAWTAYASDPTLPTSPGYPGYPVNQYPASQYPAGPYHPGYGPAWIAAPSAHDRFDYEMKAVVWGKLAFFGFVLLVAVALASAWGEGTWFRRVIDQINTDTATGAATSNIDIQSGKLIYLSWGALLVDAGVYTALLIWQYRAAKTAQLLQLPAKLSPGLGVGGWLIPVVNFWFPYQAIRDCLPPGHPGRKVVVTLWSFYIAMLVAQLVTVGLALAGSPAGFVGAAVTLGCTIAFAVNGAKTAQLIADSHRQLLLPGGPDPSVPAGR